MAEDSPQYLNFIQNTKNRLLARDDVGKSKSICVPLPGREHEYGKRCAHDREGAGAVISSWQIHSGRGTAKSGKDFRKLNKLSVRNKCTTSSQQNQFRKENTAQLPYRSGKIVKERIVTEEAFAFGQPTRPSTPMYGVMGNLYGRVSAEINNEAYYRPQSAVVTGPNKTLPIRNTKAYDLMNAYVKSKMPTPAAKQDEFKIQRFTKTAPRTNTHAKKPFAQRQSMG